MSRNREVDVVVWLVKRRRVNVFVVRGRPLNEIFWFPGKTVASLLAYRRPSIALRKHCPRDTTLYFHQLRRRYAISRHLYKANIVFINLEGVYALLFGTRLGRRETCNDNNNNVGLVRRDLRRFVSRYEADLSPASEI